MSISSRLTLTACSNSLLNFSIMHWISEKILASASRYNEQDHAR